MLHEFNLKDLRRVVSMGKMLEEFGDIKIINTSNVLAAVLDYYCTSYSRIPLNDDLYRDFRHDVGMIFGHIDSDDRSWPESLNKDLEKRDLPYMCSLSEAAAHIHRINHSTRRAWIKYFKSYVGKDGVSLSSFLNDFSNAVHNLEGTMKTTVYSIDSCKDLIDRYLLPFSIVIYSGDVYVKLEGGE